MIPNSIAVQLGLDPDHITLKQEKVLASAINRGASNKQLTFLRDHYTRCSYLSFKSRYYKDPLFCCKCESSLDVGDVVCRAWGSNSFRIYCMDCWSSLYYEG